MDYLKFVILVSLLNYSDFFTACRVKNFVLFPTSTPHKWY